MANRKVQYSNKENAHIQAHATPALSLIDHALPDDLCEAMETCRN